MIALMIEFLILVERIVMNIPKELYMTRLRDRSCTKEEFRTAAHNISLILAYDCLQLISTKSKDIQTPVSVTRGIVVDQRITLVVVLRSGTAMLQPFLSVFPNANVGVFGLKRDEKTAEAHWYYKNIPPITHNDLVIVLDPMIATGGTMTQVLNELMTHGAQHDQIVVSSIITSAGGRASIEKFYPDVTIISAAQDPDLNSHHFIVPGLGDFGDRYFGTL